VAYLGGGGGCATASPFGVVYAGGGQGPPPFGVIRGAVVGVWLEFLHGSREGSGKKVVKIFGGEFVEIGLCPEKKVVKY
jgi:hypothetical protein